MSKAIRWQVLFSRGIVEVEVNDQIAGDWNKRATVVTNEERQHDADMKF